MGKLEQPTTTTVCEALSLASEADDVPMARVPLGFSFFYGGQRFRVAYINPNGALFFSPMVRLKPRLGEGDIEKLCAFSLALAMIGPILSRLRAGTISPA